jgi:ribosomal protein S12 methylthiotransferase
MARTAARASAPTVALISLGCAKNQVDSELILSSFLEHGFRMVDAPESADLVVINTCGFIGPAKEQSVETILDAVAARKRRPGMKVMVAGCLYQRYPHIPRELPEVDYWLGEPRALHVEATVRQVMADMGVGALRVPGEPEMYRRRVLLSEPGSAFLRISQGCDRTCAFCSIPRFKGPLASRTIDQIVRDVDWLTSRFGVHEVNLVAQDLTSFGTDRGGSEFSRLLEALETRTSARWFRLHYIYPFGLTPGMLAFLAQARRFARYLDIPFQHGDDEMLRRMRRGGTRTSFLDWIARIRSILPGVALRTTLIVGHPGEEERHFENLLSFVRQARFEWMGVFQYSTEESTASGRMPGKVHASVKARRAEAAMEAFREVRSVEAFRLGEERDALVVEEGGQGTLTCRTEREAPDVDGSVIVPTVPGVRPGRLVRITVEAAHDMDFSGRIVARSGPEGPASGLRPPSGPRAPGARAGAAGAVPVTLGVDVRAP